MVKFHLLLFLGWAFFTLSHSLMALWGWKNFLLRVMGRYFRYYRLLYSIMAFLILGLVVGYQYSHSSIRLFTSSLAWVAGLPLAATGVYIMGVCIKKYFANLSGIDVFTKETAPMVLETGGLHRFMRHPLYAGTLLFMWSMFLLFPYLNNLIACAVSTVYVLIGISLEERKLVKEYGTSYIVYASKTPRLIPFLRIL